MKIALVHNQCLEYRSFLFRALAERYPIDFLFFNESGEFVPEECSWRSLKGFRVPELSDYWIVPGLRRALAKEKYGLVIGGDLGAFNTAVAYRYARRRGLPFIPWILEWDYIRHPRRLFRRRFEDRLLRYCSGIVTPGIRHREYLEGRGAGPEKIFTVPNCLEEKPCDIDRDAPLYKMIVEMKGRGNVICSIGRHVGFKGHHQSIRAQKILEERDIGSAPFLVIAGDGPLLGRNTSLARSLGLKKTVFMERHVDTAEKNILYSLCDIFLLTSTRTRAYEAWGLVCNEAVRFGRPVIASDAVGCAGELVRHGENGFVFKDGDFDGLAGYISRILGDDGLRERLSRSSREIYGDYRPQRMIDSFCAAIDSMTGQGQ